MKTQLKSSFCGVGNFAIVTYLFSTLAVLAAGVLWLGVYPGPVVTAAESGARALFGG